MAFADAQVGGKIISGSLALEVVLSGPVLKGDLVGYSSGWKRALATTGTAIQGRGVAALDGKSRAKVVIYMGECLVGGRFSGMTPGNPIYGAEGTSNGKYTETIPSTSGDVNKVVGVAVTDTIAIIDPNNFADSEAA